MRINPKENIYGQYKVSPDISITHRAIILGALAKGKTYIINPCLNDDTYTSIACIKKLGAKAKVKNGVIEIKPPKAINGDIRVDCGRSETLMRFLCGVAAGSGIGVELTGDKWLCQRPMRNVKEPLEAMGATVALKNYSVPPILVEGATVRPIDYFLPIGSSQGRRQSDDKRGFALEKSYGKSLKRDGRGYYGGRKRELRNFKQKRDKRLENFRLRRFHRGDVFPCAGAFVGQSGM